MDKNKKRDIVIRILAVLIAIILWLYEASIENPPIPGSVNVPVQLINMDSLSEEGFVLISSQNTIKLTINGRKLDVQSVKPEDFKAEANLAGSPRLRGTNSVLVELKDWPSKIQIPNQPLYITVELDQLVENSFPVKVSTEGTPKEGYSSLTATVKPTEVLLKGPSKDISSVNSVVVKPNISDATSDVTASLPIQLLDKSGKPIAASTIQATPNTVDITIPIQRSKTIPVNVTTAGQLPAGVFSKSISASPSSVTIIGSEALVNGINSIDTDPIDLGTVTGNTTRQVKLRVPEGVTVAGNQQAINVNISVETTISRNYNVPVSYINLPDGLNADLITNTIAVTVTGQESFLNGITSADFSAVIDLANTQQEDGEYEFTPKVTPDTLSITNISPQKVKVKITKKQG